MVIHNLAAISTIWIAIVGLIIAVIEGAILYLLIKVMIMVNEKVSNLFPQVQKVFRQANQIVHKASDTAAAPLIGASAKAAQVRAMQRSVTGLIRTKGRM